LRFDGLFGNNETPQMVALDDEKQPDRTNKLHNVVLIISYNIEALKVTQLIESPIEW
jgi:hypothetical protein